jgi:hypothetical protein
MEEEFMHKSWLRIITGIFVCLAVATAAFAASMDTQGESCGNMSCHVNTVAVKTTTPEKIVYEFTGVCGYWNYSSDVACPPAVNVTVTGEWFMTKKAAHEKIFKPIGNTSSVMLYSETYSNCPENPWLKAGVSCTVYSGSTKPGEKYPRSAVLLSSAQRQSLASQQPSNALAIPTPGAPLILTPVQNQKFGFIPANVKIEVSHNMNYGIQFEFQSRGIPPQGGVPEAYKPVTGVTLQNQQTSKGITTGTLVVTKPGQWLFRTMSNFPGAPWSEWRAFTVDKLTIAPALQMKEGVKRIPLPMPAK